MRRKAKIGTYAALLALSFSSFAIVCPDDINFLNFLSSPNFRIIEGGRFIIIWPGIGKLQITDPDLRFGNFEGASVSRDGRLFCIYAPPPGQGGRNRGLDSEFVNPQSFAPLIGQGSKWKDATFETICNSTNPAECQFRPTI